MKKYLHISLVHLITLSAFGQNGVQNDSISFDKIVGRFQQTGRNYLAGQKNESVSASSLYKTDEFNLSISEDPIAFDTTHLVIENPYYTDDFDDYDDNYINYPVSYSVIYDNALISLFGNGKFVCHSLVNKKRDLSFEQKLNMKKFKYHWMVDDELGAISGNTVYIWDDNKWNKSNSKFPLKKQPKLYEDDEFVVFRDCHGEWGGTVYFFDKTSGETFFTESTCTNTVTKRNGKYMVLAHLGHMIGSSEIKSITNPHKLTKAKKREINKTKNGEVLDYTDTSDASKTLLDIYGIQIFSAFEYESRQLYIAHLNQLTFLAEIEGAEIRMVHPLFDNEIYTHNPITSAYEKYTLVNLDHYGTALDKEVSVIIIDGKNITKIDWNEDHSR